MSALATLLGTYAIGHALTHGGKTFVFSRIDKAKRVALEVAYYRRAREIVYGLKDDLDEEQYERQLTRVTDAYQRGRYGFPHGESFAYYASAGLPELVIVLTGCGADEAESLCQERTLEVMHVCLCVSMESFPDFKKKSLRLPDTPEMTALLGLLSETPISNGSPCSRSTGPPDSSPTAASASQSMPG
jgi:hypothetical protein